MLDVIVIGSGYGGSVMAARLAPHGRVLVLERGRSYTPSDLPRTLREVARARHHGRNPLGLWGMRLGRGTGNAYVSGVGGASLVNYGITARPDDHVLARWPGGVAAYDPWYAKAREVLRPSPAPIGPSLGDMQVIDELEPGRRVDLENTIDWERCTYCGRCVPGCPNGSKRNLEASYLGLARAAGAMVAPEREVIGLERLTPSDRPAGAGAAWRAIVRHTDSGELEALESRHVVLAGGTFGTMDLLHRERALLPLSPWFGRAMSMNGDALAFIYNTRAPLSGNHGAPITTSARVRFVDPGGLERTLTIMSGRIPAVVMRASAFGLMVVSRLVGHAAGPRDEASKRARRVLLDALRLDPRGALAHTFMYKLDAEDSSSGYAVFDGDGQVALEWPDYQEDPIMRFAAARLEAWAMKLGGTVVPDVSTLPGMRSFGVHALGGCRMGATVDDGVVDAVGRVFDPRGGVYPGLRVVDASILPSALGVPSSLTIAALAERAAADLAPVLRA